MNEPNAGLQVIVAPFSPLTCPTAVTSLATLTIDDNPARSRVGTDLWTGSTPHSVCRRYLSQK
jgi:hypothetical protein